MLLYYIQGSPFARMVRVLLRELEMPCDEKMVEEFPPSVDFFKINPLGQVPVLEDGIVSYFPTSIILKRVMGKAGSPTRTLELNVSLASLADEQLLMVLLAMGDMIATTQYLKWAGVTGVGANRLGFEPSQRNHERVMQTLDWLEMQAGEGGFRPPAISVHDVVFACLMLWTESRGPISWRGRPKLEAIVSRLEARPSFTSTAPLPLLGYK